MENRNNTGKKNNIPMWVAYTGAFSALAVAFSFVESLSGINSLIPLPGVKLGLANIVVLCALMCAGTGCAYAVVLVRCAVTLVCFGNPVGVFMSLCGGLAAVSAMSITAKLCFSVELCSLVGVSVAGAFFHISGQIAGACIVAKSLSPLALFPLLSLLCIATGIVTGIAANAVYTKTSGFSTFNRIGR